MTSQLAIVFEPLVTKRGTSSTACWTCYSSKSGSRRPIS
jgi:hypothetical protein